MISVWEQDSWYGPADCLIVGGGLTGLWTAYALLQRRPEWRVVIAEARALPAMAATRNAGFACFGSPTEMLADAATMGEAAMWEVVDMRFRGIARIREALGDRVIGYEPSGGYECLPDGEDDATWHDKLAWLNEGMRRITGQEHVFEICSEKMGEMGLQGFAALAGNRLEGGLHSGMLVSALLNRLLAMGVRWLPAHTVAGVVEKSGRLLAALRTPDGSGAQLAAGQVIWATNSALGEQWPDTCVVPARGTLLLSPPLPEFALRGTFHSDEGYYYFRDLGNRLLIGGARHTDKNAEETRALAVNENIRQALQVYVSQHFVNGNSWLQQPGWQEWTGIMAFTPGKQPMLRQMAPGQWAAVACNGMGVALTPVFGERMAQAVLSNS